MAGGLLWAAEEIRELERLFPFYPNERLADMFPGRSRTAINTIGSKYGWKKVPEATRTARKLGRKKLQTVQRKTTAQGYIKIKCPDHPYCDKNGFVNEHRLVLEGVLGRYLLPDEVAHHINEKKGDNRPENLELMIFSEHSRHHSTGRTVDSDQRRAIGEHSKKRLATKSSNPTYRQIDAGELQDAILKLGTVDAVCARFGIVNYTFYAKLEELDLSDWYRTFRKNNPRTGYRHIEADVLRQAIITLKKVRLICEKFQINNQTFYDKLREFGMWDWYVEWRKKRPIPHRSSRAADLAAVGE